MWIWTVERGAKEYSAVQRRERRRLVSLISLFIHSIDIQTFTELLLWVKDYSGHWDCRETPYVLQ